MSSKLKVNNIIPSTGTQIGISTTGGGINLLTGTVVTGVVTATSFSGALTGTASGNPTLANGSNNRVITATSSSALTGETNFTFDGQTATINGTSNDTPLIVDTTNSNGAHMRFRTNGGTQHFLGCGGGMNVGDSQDLSMRAYDNLLFATGNSATEKLRIDASGQATHTYDIGSDGDAGLILNTDDATKAPSILFRANSENRARLDVKRRSGDGGIVTLQVSRADNSNNLVNVFTSQCATSGDTTPDLTLGGNLVLADGAGIDFSANTNDEGGAGSISANGEILDDYEEGSWTPNPSGAGTINGTSISYSGYYTKVGRVVHLEFYANNSAGDIEIPSYKIFTGLPFATGSGNYGTGRIMTEDGEQLVRQGDIIVGGSAFLINKCGSSSGTVRLGGTVTYIAT